MKKQLIVLLFHILLFSKMVNKEMKKLQFNISYLISSICSLVLAGYLWLVFLPAYEFTAAYEFAKRLISVLTVLLVLVAGIQFFLAIKRK